MSRKIAVEDSPQPRRSIFLMIVLCALAFSIYKLILVDRMGFCYQRLWFVSSEELILNHIGGLMKPGLMKLDAVDTSPKEYISRHPNCCKVSRGNENPFSRGLTAFGSATVSITYELSDKGRKYYSVSTDKNNVETYYEHIANDTACGETLGYIGTTTRAPDPHKPASNQ